MASIFKLALLGDTSTGKTSFLTQLIYQLPERVPKPTDQPSFFTMRISNPNYVVQIWDSPGHFKYDYQTVSSLNGFQAALIFIDVTNQHTFARAKTFIERLSIYPTLQIHLIQSKISLIKKSPHKRKVNEEQLKSQSNKLGGALFQYDFEEKVEEIVQAMIEWPAKNKVEGPMAVKNVEQNNLERSSSSNDPFCECCIY